MFVGKLASIYFEGITTPRQCKVSLRGYRPICATLITSATWHNAQCSNEHYSLGPRSSQRKQQIGDIFRDVLGSKIIFHMSNQVQNELSASSDLSSP